MNENPIKAFIANHKATAHVFALVVVTVMGLYYGVDSIHSGVDGFLAHYPTAAKLFGSLVVLYAKYSNSLKELAK